MATPTTMHPATHTEQRAADGALLQLIWLASPALPIGGFSYSEGLEAAIDAGLVADEDTAGSWLLDQLALGIAAADLPVLLDAMARWQADDHAGIDRLNSWWLATRETAEACRQTEQMGRSLTAWLPLRPATDPVRLAVLRALTPAPSHPIAFALAATTTGASAHAAALAFAFGWAENMVQAAVKAVPLGQSAGQRMLGKLAAAMPDAVAQAERLEPGERQAQLPGLAMLGARHETQYSRLFRS